jgi:hypothetical protein
MTACRWYRTLCRVTFDEDRRVRGVLCNLDEFDEGTVAGWAAGLRRILAGAVREPDRDWRQLASPAPRPGNREQGPGQRRLHGPGDAVWA